MAGNMVYEIKPKPIHEACKLVRPSYKSKYFCFIVWMRNPVRGGGFKGRNKIVDISFVSGGSV